MKRTRRNMQRIKDEVLVPQALERYLKHPLKRDSTGYATSCPIHDGNNKRAFRVSVDGRAWYCHGQCKRGGNVLDLIAALERCSIVEAAIVLMERYPDFSPRPI